MRRERNLPRNMNQIANGMKSGHSMSELSSIDWQVVVADSCSQLEEFKDKMEETHKHYLNTVRRGLRLLGKAVEVQIILGTNSRGMRRRRTK
jgi:hypothetical protein